MNQSEEHSISIQEQKSKIRERYRGVDPDTLECLPARPPENIYDEDRELRVAVYARVSTDDPRQTSSYELQKNHYTDFVNRHPNWKLVEMPHLQFSEMFLDSSCAKELSIVNNNSPEESSVLICSFSNSIPIPRFFSILEYCKQSCVFLANRLMDLVITISIFPVSQSEIIRLNCSLFFVFVPVIPSSAYMPAIS